MQRLILPGSDSAYVPKFSGSRVLFKGELVELTDMASSFLDCTLPQEHPLPSLLELPI